MMKKAIFFLLMTSLVISAFSQNPRIQRNGKIYIGIQPSFYTEPNEVEKGMYINIIPLVLEIYPNEWIGVQVNSIFSLRFGGDAVEISQVGFGASLPFYMGMFNASSAISRMYVGPKLSGTYNFYDGTYVGTAAGVLGYSIDVTEKIIINLEGQLGASFFFRDDFAFQDVISHLGFIFHAGIVF